ncbi:hypothetical protein [Rhodococcus sp. NPDC003348]
MKRATRLLAGTLTTLALAVGMATAAATTANAALIDAINGNDWTAYPPPAGTPAAYPGMFIDFTGDMGADGNGITYVSKYCTMGVVGTDSAGRKIGITAGHCSPPASWKAGTTRTFSTPGGDVVRSIKYTGPARGTVLADNDYPVYDRDTAKWADQEVKAGRPKPVVNPIGWVRWVDGDVCDWVDDGRAPADQELDGFLQPCPEDPEARVTDLDSRTDYMVIEFAPEVQLSSQVLNKTRQPVTSTAGSGKPFKVNSIYTDSSGAPALPGVVFNYVELYGARTDRDPDLGTGVITTPSNGMITNVSRGMIRAAAGFSGGDSGGPVVLKGTGKWVGIVAASTGDIPPWVNTSAKNILGDLNPRGIVGSGFTPINN